MAVFHIFANACHISPNNPILYSIIEIAATKSPERLCEIYYIILRYPFIVQKVKIRRKDDMGQNGLFVFHSAFCFGA